MQGMSQIIDSRGFSIEKKPPLSMTLLETETQRRTSRRSLRGETCSDTRLTLSRRVVGYYLGHGWCVAVVFVASKY